MDSLTMLRAAVLGAVLVVLGLGGCGDEGSSERGGSASAPAPTATATPRDDYYAEMDDLLTRLDSAVAAAISGENAVPRITRVIRDVRRKLRERRAAGRGESPAGDFVLTTAASARDYARNGNRQGLELIRDVPLVEARDALRSEAASR